MRSQSPTSKSAVVSEDCSETSSQFGFRNQAKEEAQPRAKGDKSVVLPVHVDSSQSQLATYVVYSSKLVKFRDTRLKAIRFNQSGQRGKLLITFDQRGIIRFHKIRGFKYITSHDFGEDWHNLDYIFTN